VTTFTLEPLTAADGEFRLEVYRATIKPYIDDLFDWDDATQERIILDQLGAGTHAAIVVVGQRVGVLQVEESPEILSLSQIEILPAFQGRGIGTAVVRSLMARGDREGKSLTLHVFRANVSARRLYERLGFVIAAEDGPVTVMTYAP
jgi:ribosomal protein S18 acetylase RimI-like enzyme